MIGSQIIELGFSLYDKPTGGRFDQDGRVLALQLLNIGYKDVCRKTLCATSPTDGTITTAADQREYSLPSGCLAVGPVFYQDERLRRIDPGRISGNSGYPVEYYLRNGKMGIEYKPNAAYAVTFPYFLGPTTDLTQADTPTLIPSDWHHILGYYLAWQFFDIDLGSSSEEAQKWQSKYLTKLDEMKDALNELISNDEYTPVG